MIRKFLKLISHSKFVLSGEYKVTRLLNSAYNNRDWDKFDDVLNKLNSNSILYRLWNTMRLGYFMKLQNASETWRKLHEDARNKRHSLSEFAFKNYVYSLIADLNLPELNKELPNFKNLYNSYLSLGYLPALCALYIKNNEYKLCIDFLDSLEDQLKNKTIFSQFKLKSYPYYSICNTELNQEVKSFSNISQNLIQKMDEVFQPESPARSVLDDCKACWQLIKEGSSKFFLDVRYDNTQKTDLKDRVELALKNKEPFMLLRLGDGEAYAFAKDSKEYETKITQTLEDFWWGVQLTPEIRESIITDFKETFSASDVIGMPYAIRLNQILTVYKPAAISYSDMRLKVLFKGVKNFLHNNEALNIKYWTDEYCNYTFVDESYMSNLIQISKNVVLVTCFDIPETNIFNHEKVKVIQVPPVKKISLVANVTENQKSLPEIMEQLKQEVAPHLFPGTLLLLSAGFAGKSILKLAKDKGSVAIDFGSSIDHMLGFKTRNLELHILYDDAFLEA